MEKEREKFLCWNGDGNFQGQCWVLWCQWIRTLRTFLRNFFYCKIHIFLLFLFAFHYIYKKAKWHFYSNDLFSSIGQLWRWWPVSTVFMWHISPYSPDRLTSTTQSIESKWGLLPVCCLLDVIMTSQLALSSQNICLNESLLGTLCFQCHRHLI